MASRLSDHERELIERALDAYACATSTQDFHHALVLGERALRIVRELPRGNRRVRSDFDQRRAPGQMEMAE